MQKIVEKKTYKSPQRKLVKFFEKSRNQWKNKCQKAKKTVKLFKNRNRFLEASKNYWKNRVKELEEELAQLKAKDQARQKELDALKKKLLKNRQNLLILLRLFLSTTNIQLLTSSCF